MKEGEAYFVDGPVPETPENASKEGEWGKTEVVGSRKARVDAYERVSGTAVYPHDVSLPDMLHGLGDRMEIAHAVINDGDFSHDSRS